MVVRWTMRDYFQGQTKRLAFTYTGGVQQWTVPEGIGSVYLRLRGGNGGGQITDGIPSGGVVQGTLQVNPGDVLSMRVGGDGLTAPGVHGAAGGWNGGGKGGEAINSNYFGGCGGGGYTDVRLNGTDPSDIVAIAAGAGGNSGGNHIGGTGGANTGNDGKDYQGNTDQYSGLGGTQTAGGQPGHIQSGDRGTAGSSLQGGVGADDNTYGSGGGGAGLFGGGGGGNLVRIDPLTGPINQGDTHYNYGGGGGSNWIGLLDPTQQIVNQRGSVIHVASQVPLAQVEIDFTGQSDVYQFEINPNDGGSPEATKQLTIAQNVGPNRINLIQEGRSTTPTLQFSGVILTQTHYEALELWFDRNVLIEMIDDLGRTFYGVFSKFSPKRERRSTNYWYHTYDAEFAVSAYINASGQNVYGRVL